MKVIISAYRCDPNAGGEPLRSWTWINYYLKEGFEVVCLTNKWDKPAIEAQNIDKPNLIFVYVDTPNWVERLYVNTVGVYLHYLLWQKYATKTALNLHKVYKFDLAHHTSYGSLQLGSGLWRLGIPFIMGPMGGGQFAPKAFKKYFYEGWKEEVFRYWVSKLLILFNPNARDAMKNAEIVITENFETQELALRLGAKKTKMFLDAEIEIVDKIFPKAQKKQINILWVGRLLPRKGLKLAIEALSLLKDRVDFKFTIIGDGPFGKRVPGWLKEYGIEEKTQWLGQVPFEHVKSHYKENDLFLFTSLRDSSGAQLFEAMAYGLPIVTLNQSGARALLPEDTCLKVEVSSPEKTIKGISESVLQYYQNRELLNKHGYNATQYIKNEYCKKIPALIKSIKGIYEKKSILIAS